VDFALGVLAFWPALALGSFANVVAARVPLRRSVVKPRSACPSCGAELAWHDNVPVLSYLLLRGRCRSCHVPIGWIYPAVELAIGGLAAACFVHFGLSGEAFVASFFCAVLVVLSAIDLRHRIVPNRLVLPAALVVLAQQQQAEQQAVGPAHPLGRPVPVDGPPVVVGAVVEATFATPAVRGVHTLIIHVDGVYLLVATIDLSRMP